MELIEVNQLEIINNTFGCNRIAFKLYFEGNFTDKKYECFDSYQFSQIFLNFLKLHVLFHY